MSKRRSASVDTRVILLRGQPRPAFSDARPVRSDSIYIDPPFHSNRNHEVLSGETGEKCAFEDRHASTAAYIDFMRPRCVELHRVLKATGSFYCHCDWHASHYLKVLLDQVFGEGSFINEIVWAYESGGRATRHFHRKHDVLFLYSPAAEAQSHVFNGEEASIPRNRCDACGTVLEKWNHLKKETDADGRVCRTIQNAGKAYKYYDDEAVIPSDVWHISHLQQKDPERLGYPTQKPLALLDRILKASSNRNDVVLDAFCGWRHGPGGGRTPGTALDRHGRLARGVPNCGQAAAGPLRPGRRRDALEGRAGTACSRRGRSQGIVRC